jgi:phosphatidylglycerophosphatase A
MLLGRHAAMFLATGFFVGRIPVAPGTLGSLIGIPVAFFLARWSWPLAAGVTIIMALAAVRIAGEAERQLEAKDPGCIVIDEIVGMCVALLAIPLTLQTGLAGFVLFRVFDIVKPPPVRWLERRLSGGWGIVMDDVAAGIMANIVLRLGLWFFHQY